MAGGVASEVGGEQLNAWGTVCTVCGRDLWAVDYKGGLVWLGGPYVGWTVCVECYGECQWMREPLDLVAVWVRLERKKGTCPA